MFLGCRVAACAFLVFRAACFVFLCVVVFALCVSVCLCLLRCVFLGWWCVRDVCVSWCSGFLLCVFLGCLVSVSVCFLVVSVPCFVCVSWFPVPCCVRAFGFRVSWLCVLSLLCVCVRLVCRVALCVYIGVWCLC